MRRLKPALGPLARRLKRERVTTAMELAGAGAVTAGVAQIYVPAGWIVGGLVLIGLAYLLAIGGDE